jgi:hypothetical protein
MPTDPRKRQRKLERRSGKRKEKQHVVAREQAGGLAQRLTAAVKYPVLHSRVSDVLWTQGIGQVLLSRALPNGTVAVAVFLVDRYCLGVKDAFGAVLGRSSYDERFVRQTRAQFVMQDVTPAAARKIVENSVAYAHDGGLPPHADYQKVKILFGDINASECQEEFEFGKDGKPFFVAGPHDGPARCRQIVNILTRTCGPDGFHYLIPFGDPGTMLPNDQAGDMDGLIDFDREEDDGDEGEA